MKIVDIFGDSTLMKKSALASIGRRFTSDCNAIGGATLEEQIIKNFNQKNRDYVILNVPTIKLAMNTDKYQFDYGAFALDFEDLLKKTKLSEGPLSAADFFLFKRGDERLILVDAASLKTSVPSDPFGKRQSPCFIHNDADGKIYEWVRDGVKKKNIGNIILLILRSDEIRTYHFDGNLDNLMKEHFVGKKNKHEDYYVSFDNSKFQKHWGLYITNRNAVTGNKPTSFRRGIKVPCSKTTDIDYFDAMDMFVKKSAMKQICYFKVDMTEMKKKTLNEFGL